MLITCCQPFYRFFDVDAVRKTASIYYRAMLVSIVLNCGHVSLCSSSYESTHGIPFFAVNTRLDAEGICQGISPDGVAPHRHYAELGFAMAVLHRDWRRV